MTTANCFRACVLIFAWGWGISSPSAATLEMKLLLPVNLDTQGKQVPETPQFMRIFSYFERNADLKFTILNLPWKRAQLEAKKGNGVLYGFSESSERLKQYRFSEPVTKLSIWAVSYGEYNPRFSKLSDLNGKRAAVGAGINHGLEYEKARSTVFVVQEDFLSFRYRLRALVTKECDFLLYPSNSGGQRDQLESVLNDTIIPELNDPQLIGRRFEFSNKPIFHESIHFASGKGRHNEALDRIDKAIHAGTKDGSLQKLFD
jgi:ABC-type amino acid transport substrate-binding protein